MAGDERELWKSSFLKVYGELLFFSFLPGLHTKTIFFIPGVAILLLVVIALYSPDRAKRKQRAGLVAMGSKVI